MRKIINSVRQIRESANRKIVTLQVRLCQQLSCSKGQGTTEYAILVGVLVVIAILAIVAFRPKVEQLWRSIAEAIEQL